MKTLKRDVTAANVVTITIITATIVIMNVIVVTTNSTKLKIVGGGARLPAFS
nr:hypothetical protein [Paenibacillus polymyxa]